MNSPEDKLNPKELRVIVENLEPFLSAPLTFRFMFGGIMAYLDGKPFLTLYDGGVGIKLKETLFQELCAVEGAETVRYEPNDAPSKSYVKVPGEWLLDEFQADDLMVVWCRRAADQVLATPRKAK